MAKQAIIYARVSTEEQGKGYSLPTQQESCRSYARTRGYEVLAEFTEMYSGTELDRPELNAMYRFLETQSADVLIVHDIDRLAREVGYQAIIETELARAGIKVEYVIGQYAETPEGELLKLIKSGIAQYENRQRTERSRRGKRGRAEAGFVMMPASRAPFGYDYISEKRKGWLVINEAQAEVIQLMFRWLVVDGHSSYAIARMLFEKRVLTKGDISTVVHKKEGPASWSPATVRRILSNPVYKGTWCYGKTRRRRVAGRVKIVHVPESEWVKVDVPAIVDEDTWRQAQDALKRNKQNAKRNTRRNYLLRSMVFCPCGRRWTVVYKSHLKRAYYRCPTNEAEHWRHRCDNRFSIRQERLEQAVWDKVVSFLLQPDLLREEVEHHRAQTEEETQRVTRRLDAIKQASADIDRKLDMLLDEALTGGFSRAIIDNKRIQLADQRLELQKEAERLQESIQAMTFTQEQEVAIAQFADEIKEPLKDLTFENKRRVLELIKLRVDVISRDQVKLSGVISP
ncbi:MAG: recombinase family protein, partial [Planctomycetales bacterium]|nr:recombinase family protein [Planctomycetales bacterium]